VRNAERLRLQIVLPKGYEAGPSGAPALTVDTRVPTLSEDPTLSAFVAPALATATAVSSPAFTQSRHQSDQEESDSPGAQNNDSTTDELFPEQQGQEEPVLEAQLAYRLDVQDREPENPLTPEQPDYQGLIEDAVQAGLNVPPPPPLVQPVAPQFPVPPIPQFPAPKPIALAPAMAAAAQVPTCLVGNTPDIFNGDRTKAEDFKLQFQLHQALNNNNRIMASPYYRTSYALSLIKGSLVKDWVKEQVSALIEKVTRTVNRIGEDEDVLWEDYATAVRNALLLNP
jgi:hypothetical protein